MQSGNDVQVKDINPCNLQTDEEKQLLYDFLLARKDQPFIPAGDYTINGIKFTLQRSLLRRTREVFGLSKPQIKFDVLNQDEPLAQGGFGVVYAIEKSITLGSRFLHIKDDNKHVVKLTFESALSLNDKPIDATTFKEAQSERDNLNKSDRFHLKEFQHIINNDIAINFLTMRQFTGTTLHEILPGNEKLTTDQRFRLTIALLRALKEQVHDLGLIHRDIKPSNIIVNLETMEVNIIDFGLSIENKSNNNNSAQTGHYQHVSPEIINGSRTINEKSDIFSMGRVLSLLWGDTGVTWQIPPLLTIKKLQTGDFNLQSLFNADKQFKDLKERSRKPITRTIDNMVSHEARDRNPIDILMDEFNQIYFDHCNPDINRNISQEFNYGMEARKKLSNNNYKAFCAGLKSFLDKINDDETSISAFTQGLGVHCLQAAKSKNDISKKIEATIDSFNKIASNYIDLFNKAAALVSKYDVRYDSKIFSELCEFTYEMHEKINRIKSKPCDLDLIVKTTQSLNHSYPSWQDRLKEVENDFRKNDHFKRIATIIEATLKPDKPGIIDISIPHKQEKLRLDLESLQEALRAAIRKYIDSTLSDSNLFNRKRAASDRRVKDMQDFIQIIDTATDAITLRKDTKNRIKDIEKGFFGIKLFGRSKLRDNLNKALKIHKYKTIR